MSSRMTDFEGTQFNNWKKTFEPACLMHEAVQPNHCRGWVGGSKGKFLHLCTFVSWLAAMLGPGRDSISARAHLTKCRYVFKANGSISEKTIRTFLSDAHYAGQDLFPSFVRKSKSDLHTVCKLSESCGSKK